MLTKKIDQSNLKLMKKKCLVLNKVYSFHGEKVKLVEFVKSNRGMVLSLKSSKGASRKFEVLASELEEIVPAKYHQKDPIRFLERRGFSKVASDPGYQMMEKKNWGF